MLKFQLSNIFKKPECKIIFDEVQGRHRHKLIDRNDNSERYPTFFDGEDITGIVEIKIDSKSLKHKGIKAELHGVIEKYGTINKNKSILQLTSDISRPEEITQEKTTLEFAFKNVKLPFESYKGDYATVKYFIKIIILHTIKNEEYTKEFAVVNPNDKSILDVKDEPIKLQVGMKNKMSLSIYFLHKNYNCRGTLKGFINFNFINVPLKFMEVQIVRREVVFGDKKCEPAYVARYELIDGIPNKDEKIPIRFFLKSYNLTPTYPNIDGVFCVKYFLNLVMADEDDNRYFKQKEIKLFRLYKERKNSFNNSNKKKEYNYYSLYNYYNNNQENDEVFITEPIKEEDFSLYYNKNKNKTKNQELEDEDNQDDYEDDYMKPNDNYSNERKNSNGYNNRNNNMKNFQNNKNKFNERNNYNYNDDNKNTNDYNFNKNNNSNKNMNDNNKYSNNNNNIRNNTNSNINKRNNIIENDLYNNYNGNKRINNDQKNINMNSSNNRRGNNKNYNNDEDDYDDDNYNKYNKSNKDNYINEDNYNNDNYNTGRTKQNNSNKNRSNNNTNYNNNYNDKRKNEFININPSSYFSIKTKNTKNSYDEKNLYDDDDIYNQDNQDKNYRNKNSNNNIYDDENDMEPQTKNKSNYRNNLMHGRISNEDDFKNIFNSIDKNVNKEEIKKNIFG